MFMHKLLFSLVVVLLFPMAAFAQDSTRVDIDDYVEELNSACPIPFNDSWGANSFTMVGDNYVLVDLQVPTNLSMVLSVLTDDTENAKQMWIKQLSGYGEPWTRFVELMVENERRIVVNLRPKDREETALITFYPDDFKK